MTSMVRTLKIYLQFKRNDDSFEAVSDHYD